MKYSVTIDHFKAWPVSQLSDTLFSCKRYRYIFANAFIIILLLHAFISGIFVSALSNNAEDNQTTLGLFKARRCILYI